MQILKKDESFCRFVVATLAQLALCGTLLGQCAMQESVTNADKTQIQQFYDEKNWAEVVRLASSITVRSADLNFEYGLALAHLQQWTQARAALVAGWRACPWQARFSLELAGVAFQEKHYPETAAWLHRGLKLDPNDAYANDFAGTDYLLMGNLNAALKYWNRVRKPYVEELTFDPQLHVQRLILDRAFAFSPAEVLGERGFETTEAWLNGLGIFAGRSIELKPRHDTDGGGKFDAEFNAVERNGFGSSRVQAFVATLSGAPYETIYPSYFNIGRSAENFESLLRWDTQKRRVWVSLSAPLKDRAQLRWRLEADARNENWAIRRPFASTEPVLGSLNLKRQVIVGSVTDIRSGRLQFSTGGEFSHRNFRNVVDGTAFTATLTVPGYELKYLASIENKVLEIPERRFSLTTGATSELARMWTAQTEVPAAPHVFEKLQGMALARWFPQAQSDMYEATEQVRAGRTFRSAPFDELFLVGMERDTNLWIRGQIGTRDGRKGSSPVGSDYFLSNTDFYRRIYGNGLITLKVGPLLDVARVGAATNSLANGQWLFDVGIEARLTVLGTSVVFTYGRDLRTGNNAFFESTTH